MDKDRLGRIETWLSGELGAPVAILSAEKLSGGAIQENWKVTAEIKYRAETARKNWVMRTDAPSSLETSHSRINEFELLRVAHEAGVLVPYPQFLCEDSGVIGAPFFVTDFVPGTANGRRIVRDPGIETFGPDLARQLGRELAKLHTITPPYPRLGFLRRPPEDAALERIATYRMYLDAICDPQPTLEWAMRLLEQKAPEPAGIVLCHSDYRTGNYMVDSGKLTGILDWEFAQWGDLYEDLGWFCANCWRFGATDREAGGIAPRADFLAGYREMSDIEINESKVLYWEIMAPVRWAVIALQQGHRYVAGGEKSLELALTGRMVPEMEIDILTQSERFSMENSHA